eukprot:855015-Rhodomonas_salina.3
MTKLVTESQSPGKAAVAQHLSWLPTSPILELNQDFSGSGWAGVPNLLVPTYPFVSTAGPTAMRREVGIEPRKRGSSCLTIRLGTPGSTHRHCQCRA